jgi:hypothetical protein
VKATLYLKAADIIGRIETALSYFYGFDLQTRAVDHLVSEDEISMHTGLESNPRGSVLVLNPAPDELYIGLFLGSDILARVVDRNPINTLSNENLDAFCVIIEELSHFHLILNRALLGQEVTQLELEWQAEVDKILVCASLLKNQVGKAHYPHLMTKILHTATYATGNLDRYLEANAFAAKFWKHSLNYLSEREDPIISRDLRKVLRRLYRNSWNEKVSKIA